VSHLRKMMLEELQRRNYAETTTRCYIRTVEEFARRFHCSPDRLGPGTFVNIRPSCFRSGSCRGHRYATFGGSAVLLQQDAQEGLEHRGDALSEEGISPANHSQPGRSRATDRRGTHAFHRTLLMTLYATGVRRAELTHLKVSDIDSQRMVIHVQSGKGRKDRDVLLSPKLLEVLREHWRGLKRKPSAWLFPGNRWHTATRRSTPRWSGTLARKPPSERPQEKSTSTTLQHRFATHLLEAARICAPSRCC